MMRSLFSGVSGLKSHQTRMDVIGNNIANVNTTGFKSSRVTFADMLSQTSASSSAPSGNLGGTNPKQIGLGTGVASIDLLFTDSSAQSTGKNTDLALNGNGLFIVKNGDETYYTRDGAFEFDSKGNYVMPGSGMKVQGYMATNGNVAANGDPTDIVIDSNSSMPASTSNMTTYTGNLNASTQGYTISNATVTYADGTTATMKNYTAVPASKGAITLKLSTGENVTLDGTATYNFEAGKDVNGKTLYTSKIESVTANPGGTVKLTLAAGTSINTIDGKNTFETDALNNGTYSIDGTYKLEGNITAVNAQNVNTVTLTVKINNADHTIVVPKPDNFTYKIGDTFSANLAITKIAANANAEVTTENGNTAKLANNLDVNTANQTYARQGTAADGTVAAVTRNAAESYQNNGKDVASVAISTTDGTTMTGLIGQKYAANGTFYPSVATTVTAYDSLGNSHAIPVLFTMTGANTWAMSLASGTNSATYTEPGGSKTTVNLTSSDITFDENGKYVDGSGALSFTYANGAKSQEVALNTVGMTQYAGDSIPNATTNGNAAGTLKSISIDSMGTITATYTNGVRRTEAQVAIASFNNASGLTKTGNSLYQVSNNSGSPTYGTVTALGCELTPSALEMSNVDIANEFSDMIITQRGFQSNSKIITVGDEMLETLINMKR